MKLAAVVIIAFVAFTAVTAQQQNNNNQLPFPFNIIQVPQIVPSPFCLCGVLPRLRLAEKDECMKKTFYNSFMQPMQDEICNRQPPTCQPPRPMPCAPTCQPPRPMPMPMPCSQPCYFEPQPQPPPPQQCDCCMYNNNNYL